MKAKQKNIMDRKVNVSIKISASDLRIIADSIDRKKPTTINWYGVTITFKPDKE